MSCSIYGPQASNRNYNYSCVLVFSNRVRMYQKPFSINLTLPLPFPLNNKGKGGTMLFSSILVLLTALITLFLLPGCTKESNEIIVKNFQIDPIRRTWLSAKGQIDSSFIKSNRSKWPIQVGLCWNSTEIPTLTDNTSKGNIVASDGATFVNTIQYIAQGLDPGSAYYFRWYVKMDGDVVYGQTEKVSTLPAGHNVHFNPGLEYGTVADIEGNLYKTVNIGNQTWMAENLKTTRFNDNSIISHVEGLQWLSQNSPAFCWYENNPKVYKDIYGAYYNWYAVNTGKLCPSGWHVPTDDEWKIMELNFGMSVSDTGSPALRGTDEGLKIRESGRQNWFAPDAPEGSNISGLTALPGGFIRGYDDGSGNGYISSNEGYSAFFWTSTRYYNSGGWCRWIVCSNSMLFRNIRDFKSGFNVRCLKD